MGSDRFGAGDTPTEEDDSRRCVECGAPLNRYAMFCSECGAEQERSDESDDRQDERGQRGRESEGSRRRERTDRRQRGGPDRQQPDSSDRRRSGGAGHNRARAPDHRQGHRSDGQAAGPDSDTGMAVLAHVAALFLGVIGSGLIYAVADDPFVKRNAANATNWQIMLILYLILSVILVFFVIGIFLFLALLVADLVFIVIAAIKASNGEAWEYPLTPELL